MHRITLVLDKSSAHSTSPLLVEAPGGETVRMLPNPEPRRAKPLQIVAPAQPRLPEPLRQPDPEQLRQRLNAIVRRRALVLRNSSSPSISPLPAEASGASGEYRDLIRRLFRLHSVVAVVAGPLSSEGIAAELAASGNWVVVVDVNSLLPNPIPCATPRLYRRLPNVHRWPTSAKSPIEVVHPSETRPLAASWLDALRRDFDTVLLDCPAPTASGVAEIAALADAAVLVIKAGRTTRQEIQRDQRTLELAGAKLAGCILSRRR